MMSRIKAIINESISVKTVLVQDQQMMEKIGQIVDLVTEAFRHGNRVYFCGNGGSAADAQHLAAEFSGRFYKNRKALPAEALHCNTSYLTAVANDYSYDDIYARLVDGIMNSGDVLFGFSTSGNSGNIIKAFEVAKTKGVATIGFTGDSGGKIRELCDHLINIPSSVTPRIQESHIMVGHIICELVEEKFFA